MTTQAQPTTPNERSTTFQAVEGNPAEQYSGTTLLVVAYSALWLVLFAWVALVWRKQSALNERLEGLERVIDKADADAKARADAKGGSAK
jgi:CcmD family protein